METFYLQWSGVRVRIREGETVIGRGSDCELHIDDPTASRRHALLRRQGNRVTVADLDSRNGTFVDADRVLSPRELRGGERLLVGETQFEVLLLAPSQRSAAGVSSIEPRAPVAPALALVEEHRGPFERERDITAPHVGTIEVLESLLLSPHARDEPHALAVMVQNSVERLLAAAERRDDVLDEDARHRLLAVLSEVEGWFPEGSFQVTAARLRGRLGF